MATNGTCTTEGVKAMEPIAIVGMACRWPGPDDEATDIDNPSKLWDLLYERRNSYSDFPSSRLNIEAWHHPTPNRPGSMYTRGGCFLNADPRDFDPSFFGINPLECKSIDPAQRKLLEVVYEAFESSGTRIEDLSGSNTGCFVGNFNTDHQLMQYRDAEYPQPYGITGGGIALLSNRINYIFNLHGPSLTLDTACSSSMYALHLACTAIQNNDCKAALVGGSNLILSPECQLFSSSLGAVSKTSMCHTFDAKADGYARADGIGALYIKSLAQAIADRDPIRAVIRGTAVNANGKTGGITHPDPDGQEAAISQAYARAGLDPSETPYMELHGTGTPVGDPLEVEAVGRVFAPGRTEDTPPLLIGSVKSNMGHAEPASGIAGVMKAVLVLEEGIVPPIRALERVNPALDLRGGRIQIVTRHTRLPEGVPRRASVNSFGYGGANAHAVLELASSWGKYKALAKKAGHTDFVNGNVDSRRRKYLLAFSAHNEKTLRANIAALARPAAKWATKDVAYTLNCRRSRFASRTFAVVEDGNASAQLESCSPTVVRLSGASKSKRLGFVFTGQGAQWPQMGLELLARFPVYLQSIRRMDSVLQHLSPPAAWSIEATLREPASTSKVYEAEISQPLVTAVQIALVDLLSSWKVRPVACVGHSSGEIAAAYASGRLSLAEAITTAYCRGQAVLANTQNGKMLAVGAGEAAVRAYLPRYPGVVCACVNSPESVTLSGDAEQIERLRSELEQQAVFARVLATGGNAYHSAHMTALGPLYEERMHEALAQIPATGPCVHRWPVAADFVSSVTGGFRSENMPVDAKYWRDNLESPVLFYAAVAQLVGQAAPDVLVEIGPHAALQGPLRQIGQALRDGKFQEYVPTMVRKQDGDTSLMQTAGTLFCTGYDIDLYRVNADEYLDPASGSVERVSEDKVVADLPTYQWQYGEQLYHENRWTREWRLRTHARHDVLGSRVPGGNLNEPVWRNVVAVKDLPWVADHTVGSDIVFPTTGFLCMAVEAATQIAELRGIDAGDVTAYDLENVILKSALVVPMDDDGVEVLVAFRPEKLDGLHFGFTVTSVTNSGGKDIFTEHVTGTVGFLTEGVAAYPAQAPETSGWNKKPSTSRWYDTFAQAGLKYGPAFQSLTDIKTPEDGEAAQCTVALTPSQKHVAEGSRYAVHPVTMDAALQLGIIAAHRGRTSKCRHSFLPTRIDSLRIWPQFVKGRTVSTTADATFLNARSSNVQLTMIGEGGAPILSALNVYFTRTESAALEPADEHAAPYARLAWKPDVEMLTRQKVLVLFESTGKRDADTMPPLELLAFHQTVQFFTRHSDLFEKGSKEPQLQRFLDWIAQKVQDSQDGKTAQGREILALSDAQRQSQIDMLEQTLMSFGEAPETQLMCHMYRSMPAIYRGSISGIQAAMQHDYLNQMYRDMTLYHAGNSALKDLIVLLSHKNPALNILEIGGGTGSATRVLLPALNGDKLYRGYGKYTFTDITSSFLATAADNFRQHTSVEFRTFDMETPPAEQGYQAEHDLVIASNVIHATSDIVRTLRHIRATLKPGGRLALFELVRPRMCWTMILGTFSDFWKGDADPMFPRCEGPFLTVEMWMRVLPMAGFSGVDLLLDCFDETRGSGVILSTAVEESASISAGLSGSHAVSLVYRHTVTESVQDFAEHLAAAGYAVELVPLTSQQRLQHSRAIFLAEIDEPLLTDINEGEWAGFKHLLLTSSSALWVTKGGLLQGGKAEYAMFSGIARTIHTENRSTKLITVDIDPNSSSTKAEVFELLRELELKAVSYIPGSDFEFRCNRDCIPYISRLTEDAALNKAAQQESKRHTSSEYKLWMPINNEDEPLRMVIDNLPDASSTAHFEPQPPFQRLSPEEIDIAVSSLSFSSDSISELERSDVAHSAHIMGVLGTVLRAGSQSIYTSGKKVLGIAPARSAGSRVRVKAHACVDVGESAADAASQSQHWLASVPVPFCAAVYGLLDLAQLQSGERVLVMSAASTVGLAACRVAALTGARVLAFVQTGEQKARVLACFSGLIREEDVLVAAALDESVSRQVMQCTDQRGIDVIFAYGEHVKAPRSWPVAPFGRIVGSTLVLSSGNGAVEALKKRASISSIDLEELLRDRPEVVARLLARIKSLLAEGLIKPSHLATVPTFSAARVRDAVGALTGATKSRDACIVTFPTSLTSSNDDGEEEQLIPYRPTPHSITFDPQASYLLIGCLGGLGRSLAFRMVSLGARNLIFLSRSGVSPKISSFIAKLHSLGAHTTLVQGDVCNPTDIQRALAHCTPPLKGVVQAALSLHDAFLQDMPHAAFTATTQPRVRGTLNLHAALRALPPAKAPLDFVLLLSSWTATLGSPGQSNYTASSAFLDAFARHARVRFRMPVAALSLGQICDVGVVSERAEAQDFLAGMGLYGGAEEAFWGFCEGALRVAMGMSVEDGGDEVRHEHLLAGLDPAGLVRNEARWPLALMPWHGDPRFGALVQGVRRARASVEQGISSSGDDNDKRNSKYSGEDDANDSPLERIRARLARLLYVPREEIDISRPISAYGIDSMVAASLRNWVYEVFGKRVGMLRLLSPHMTVEGLAGDVCAVQDGA